MKKRLRVSLRKVMTRVSLEARPVRAAGKLNAKDYVPVISLAVTLILTGIALLLPAAGNGIVTGTMDEDIQQY